MHNFVTFPREGSKFLVFRSGPVQTAWDKGSQVEITIAGQAYTIETDLDTFLKLLNPPEELGDLKLVQPAKTLASLPGVSNK